MYHHRKTVWPIPSNQLRHPLFSSFFFCIDCLNQSTKLSLCHMLCAVPFPSLDSFLILTTYWTSLPDSTLQYSHSTLQSFQHLSSEEYWMPSQFGLRAERVQGLSSGSFGIGYWKGLEPEYMRSRGEDCRTWLKYFILWIWKNKEKKKREREWCDNNSPLLEAVCSVLKGCCEVDDRYGY